MSDKVFSTLWYRFIAAAILFITGSVNLMLATAQADPVVWWILITVFGVAAGCTHLVLMERSAK